MHSRRKRTSVFTLLLLFLALISIPDAGMGASLQKENDSWKFAVISDTQGNNGPERNKSCINDSVVSAIADDIVRENPDFVLIAGDLVNGWLKNGGTDYAIQYANLKGALRVVYQAGIKVYPIRGNHDDGPERLALPPLPDHLEPPPDSPILLRKASRDAFFEPYIPKNGPLNEEGLTYSFTHKNALIVGLDQYAGGQHKINQRWLDSQLAANTSPHVFIYGHEPAFDTGHYDNLGYYPKERDVFWDSLGKAGARIYFCGHDHFYNRALIPDRQGRPIRQIIAGTGGGSLKTWSGIYKDSHRVKGEYYSNDHHGYILVTVKGTRVTASWKALTQSTGTLDAWQILDTFTYAIPAE